jgi:hypothetical protein
MTLSDLAYPELQPEQQIKLKMFSGRLLRCGHQRQAVSRGQNPGKIGVTTKQQKQNP